MKRYSLSTILSALDLPNNQNGSFAIMTGILIFIFMGMAALAVDYGHFFVVKNELQNAADAGALAGARDLYSPDGKNINTNSNQIAKDLSDQRKAIVHQEGQLIKK